MRLAGAGGKELCRVKSYHSATRKLHAAADGFGEDRGCAKKLTCAHVLCFWNHSEPGCSHSSKQLTSQKIQTKPECEAAAQKRAVVEVCSWKRNPAEASRKKILPDSVSKIFRISALYGVR